MEVKTMEQNIVPIDSIVDKICNLEIKYCIVFLFNIHFQFIILIPNLLYILKEMYNDHKY